MTDLFSAVLSMSLVGSLTAAVVVLIRAFLKRRAPRWISYGLWAVVLIRLLVPVSVPSPISLFSLVPAFHHTEAVGQSGHLSRLALTEDPATPVQTSQNGQGRQSALVAAQKALPETAGEKIQVGTENPSPTENPGARPKGRIDWQKFGAVVWMGGAIMFVGFLAFNYAVSAIRLRRLRQLPKNEKIRQAEKLLPLRRKVVVSKSHMFPMPVVFGIVHPRIVLPWGFDWEDAAAQHILLHERVHISRWDNLIKIAAVFAVCLHWFNPFIWLCFRLCSDDMEASCDERVLKILGADSRKDYARSLLSMAGKQNRRIGQISFLAFGESSLKKRVGNILKYHKKTLLSVMAALLAVLLVGCSLLTNPSSAPESSGPNNGQSASQQEGGEQGSQGSQEPQESGIPVKDPEETTLYIYNTSSMALISAEKVFYFPLRRTGISSITPSWLEKQIQTHALGLGSSPAKIGQLTQEGSGVTVALLSDASAFSSEDSYPSQYLNSIAMTLLQNCEVDSVSFTLDGQPIPDGSPYTPTELALPDLSQADIQALYDNLSLDEMVANLTSNGQRADPRFSLTNAIDRWDIGGDQKSWTILNAIYEATFLNNVPESDFDSISEAPNQFLLNAAYAQAPNISWYQDDVNPNSDASYSVLTSYVDDYECIPQKIVEETARQLFGDGVQINHGKPQYGYYHEYAMAYTPYHMGGWFPDIFLLDYTEQGDKVEATVAYSRIYGSALDPMKSLTDMDEETSVRNREQRHRFTLEKAGDSYRITGYHVVDSWRDMITRAPEYYAYTAICAGLTFFDWDGAANLTPDQLYQWFLAGYSPGMYDANFPTSTVESYFYVYSGGYQPEDPTILRQSQYYDEAIEAYRWAPIDGVIGVYDSDRKYWCEFGEISYQDENTALVPVKVYEDEAHSQLLSDGVLKMRYQEESSYPWVADGFTSN